MSSIMAAMDDSAMTSALGTATDVMRAAPAATACLLFLLIILAAGRWCGLLDIGAPSRVSCCCGKVVIEFPEAMPRHRVACGCRDCHQKVTWAAARGGPVVP